MSLETKEKEFTFEDDKMISQFEKDVLEFFHEGMRGNLWPYIYGAPRSDDDPVRGGILYNEMLENEADYYLYKYEAEIFQSMGGDIASVIGPNATFIELGPGSEQSLRLKTLPLLQACSELQGYVGIDISQSFLDKSLAVIREALPHIEISGTQQDFTKLTSIPDCEKPVVFFKGSTIANLRRDEVPPFIARIHELVGKPHYLLLVQDCNQDETSLMKAYDNYGMGVFMANIMHRIQRDLEISEMDGGAFTYKPEWVPEEHDLKHVVTATKDQQFDLRGQEVKIAQGEKFHTLSSFKYPTDVFQEMIGGTKYEVVHNFQGGSGRLAVHLFKGG